MAFFFLFLTVLAKVIPQLGILMCYNRNGLVTIIRVDKGIYRDKHSDVANRKNQSYAWSGERRFTDEHLLRLP